MNRISLLKQIVFTVIVSFLLLFLFSMRDAFLNHKETLYTLQKEKIDMIIDVVAPSLVVDIDFGLPQNIDNSLNQLLETNSYLIGVKLIDLKTNKVIYESVKNSKDAIKRTRILLDENGIKIAKLIVIYSNDDYKKAIQSQYEILVRTVITFMIFLVVFVLLLNYLFKPLTKISNKLSKFSPKDTDSFDLEMVSGNNEVSTINNATVSMVNRIRDYTRELLETNEQLEQRVRDRTKELKSKLDELKNTQEQLIQTEKMASLGGLVAGVAHEINTPVGVSLTGVTHLLEQTKIIKKLYKDENMSEEEFEDFLNQLILLGELVEKNLGRTANLVRSFKQVAVDQTSDEDRTFVLKDYIEEILLSLHGEIKKTNIDISIDVDEKLSIKSNPGAFSQIITNFILNSIIHGFTKAQNGHINIKAYKEGENLVLIYKDDGKGLSRDAMSRIFDPFFTTNRENGGSGLGMNIVYNIITQKLHGKIDIVSKVRDGIEFKMEMRLEND